jgi:Holliday junction resolvase RusA-like endonuclease
MQKTISFQVFGEAVPKARPKLVMNKYTHRPHLYTAETTRSYEESVMCQALKQKPKELIKGAIKMCIKIFKVPPKSTSKKKRALMLANIMRPIGRPDLSNYIKSIEDALNGLYWSDDGAVVEYLAGTGKYYADAPHVDVDIVYEESEVI